MYVKINSLPLICSFDTTRLLVSLGADIRAVDNHSNMALHHSATNLNYPATKVLLDSNAPVDVKNNDVRMMLLINTTQDFSFWGTCREGGGVGDLVENYM